MSEAYDAAVEAMIARLEKIRYLEHCGEPPNHEWAVPIDRDFVSAMFGCRRASDYVIFVIARMNEISAWVKDYFHVDSEEYLIQLRERIERPINTIVNRRIFPMFPVELRKSDPNTRYSAKIGFKTELTYIAIEAGLFELGLPVGIFTKLLPVYEAGRYPCGWEGEYPEGRCIAF